jgi:hypothetical protein
MTDKEKIKHKILNCRDKGKASCGYMEYCGQEAYDDCGWWGKDNCILNLLEQLLTLAREEAVREERARILNGVSIECRNCGNEHGCENCEEKSTCFLRMITLEQIVKGG